MNSRVSNIYLHPAVCAPEQVVAVQQVTGLVATQSRRERNKIILVTPFAAAMREALQDLPIHEIPPHNRSNA
jgi:hypothetical protein